MSVRYQCVNFKEGTYLVARLNDEVYISSDPCNEGIEIPLVASTYTIYEGALVITLGSDTLIILRKMQPLSSKL